MRLALHERATAWDVLEHEGTVHGRVQAGTVHRMSSVRVLPPGSVLPVSGVSYHQEFVRGMREGDVVVLEHDFANPYDQDAVRVLDEQGNLLGYLPAKSGLAARLSRTHRGGVWQGWIVEVLPGDTWGLRVRVGELVDQQELRAGAGNKGWRSSGEDLPISTDLPRGVGEAEQVAKTVRTISGRELGEYVDESGERVRVKTGNVISSWPKKTVVIS